MTESQISLLTAFHAARVDYVVVGGVAVNLHGYVRATHDLDLFIRPTRENAGATLDALRAFGAPVDNLDAGDLLSDEDNIRFGPAEDHIDVLSSIGEMPFDRVWRNREHRDIAGLRVAFISKADLIENKQQTGRVRDLADVEELRLIPEPDSE